MKKLVLGVAAAAALAVGWHVGSPYWTLHQTREAARARDADRLSAYIDYPAARDDLKADLGQMMLAAAGKDPNNPFDELGAALAMVGRAFLQA